MKAGQRLIEAPLPLRFTGSRTLQRRSSIEYSTNRALSDRYRGLHILLIDLTDGEPAEFAEAGGRAQQADEAARILGVERLTLGLRDRFLTDATGTRLQLARLIREHRPSFVYGTGEACVHPDHAAMVGLTRAAVFLARLGQWERVPGGELLADQEPWVVERLFFPHCKMEPPGASSPSPSM